MYILEWPLFYSCSVLLWLSFSVHVMIFFKFYLFSLFSIVYNARFDDLIFSVSIWNDQYLTCHSCFSPLFFRSLSSWIGCNYMPNSLHLAVSSVTLLYLYLLVEVMFFTHVMLWRYYQWYAWSFLKAYCKIGSMTCIFYSQACLLFSGFFYL